MVGLTGEIPFYKALASYLVRNCSRCRGTGELNEYSVADGCWVASPCPACAPLREWLKEHDAEG